MRPISGRRIPEIPRVLTITSIGERHGFGSWAEAISALRGLASRRDLVDH